MISAEDLCSLHQVSAQDLHKRSPGKVCVQDLQKSLSAQISLRGLLAKPLDKISKKISQQDLFMKSLYKLSKRTFLARFM